MSTPQVVVGIFTYIDDALAAIKLAQEKQLDYRVYSPVPHHELEEATYPNKSPVRFITATGAVTGLIGGFALAILTSLDYPLRVSAKPVDAVPSFIVVGFECTILFGGIATFLALLHFCRLPDILRKVGFDPRFTQDKFGVVVGCTIDEAATIKRSFEQVGADEVQVREGL
jgi:Protein of unknown function (DUF3341)